MSTDRKRVYAAIAVAVVAVCMTAAALYMQLSRRAALALSSGDAAVSMSSPGSVAPAAAASRSAAPTIEASAERLERRLREKGGAADDWALLARSYVQMRRYPEAVDAFAHALEQMPGNAAFLAEQSAARKAATDSTATR